MQTNEARMFAALSATNEAILYAKSREQLYQRVCDGAVFIDFPAAAILLLEAGTETLRFAASAGEFADLLHQVEISIAQTESQVSELAGEAIADQRPAISNDFLNDARTSAWRQPARELKIGAVAALPLTCNGRSVGVLMMFRREAGSLDDGNVAPLARMAANVSFALDNFARADETARDDDRKERLARMFAALSSTNEAIMRAKCAHSPYHSSQRPPTRLVCIESTKMTAASIFLLHDIVSDVTHRRFPIPHVRSGNLGHQCTSLGSKMN